MTTHQLRLDYATPLAAREPARSRLTGVGNVVVGSIQLVLNGFLALAFAFGVWAAWGTLLVTSSSAFELACYALVTFFISALWPIFILDPLGNMRRD